MKRFLLAAIPALALAAACVVSAEASVTVSLGPNLAPQPATENVAVTQACAVPNAPAAIREEPNYQTPALAAAMGIDGTTGVMVTLSKEGMLQDARVLTVSGSQILDREALRVARGIDYLPERQNCTSLAGAYLLSVTFSNG